MGWWRSSPSAARESWDPSQETPTEISKETPPENPLNSCPEGPLKDPLESLLLSPLQMPLLSPLASPTAAPSLICPAWSKWWRRCCGGSPEGFRLACCWHRALFPAGWCPDDGKKDKRPAPASTPRTQETSPRNNMPPEKKKMVVCWVAKHSKTLWEGKLDRDGVAVGSSGQQVGSSKRRASEDTNVPILALEQPRSPGSARGQRGLCLPIHPTHC